MLKMIAAGQTFKVVAGTNLRKALLDQDMALYSQGARVFNCQGHGACGTCLVHIEGAVSEPTSLEMSRMAFPPHFARRERRLACQVTVLGDVHVTRFDGYFGEGDLPLWLPDQRLIDETAIAS